MVKQQGDLRQFGESIKPALDLSLTWGSKRQQFHALPFPGLVGWLVLVVVVHFAL